MKRNVNRWLRTGDSFLTTLVIGSNDYTRKAIGQDCKRWYRVIEITAKASEGLRMHFSIVVCLAANGRRLRCPWTNVLGSSFRQWRWSVTQLFVQLFINPTVVDCLLWSFSINSNRNLCDYIWLIFIITFHSMCHAVYVWVYVYGCHRYVYRVGSFVADYSSEKLKRSKNWFFFKFELFTKNKLQHCEQLNLVNIVHNIRLTYFDHSTT